MCEELTPILSLADWPQGLVHGRGDEPVPRRASRRAVLHPHVQDPVLVLGCVGRPALSPRIRTVRAEKAGPRRRCCVAGRRALSPLSSSLSLSLSLAVLPTLATRFSCHEHSIVDARESWRSESGRCERTRGGSSLACSPSHLSCVLPRQLKLCRELSECHTRSAAPAKARERAREASSARRQLGVVPASLGSCAAPVCTAIHSQSVLDSPCVQQMHAKRERAASARPAAEPTALRPSPSPLSLIRHHRLRSRSTSPLCLCPPPTSPSFPLRRAPPPPPRPALVWGS